MNNKTKTAASVFRCGGLFLRSKGIYALPSRMALASSGVQFSTTGVER